MENRLSGEINIESIRALDEQIRVHEAAIAKLKRTRNSLLNIYKIPPEILGNIFRWNVMFKDGFDGFEEGSHSFLLVCRYWFEVALCTPELWSFWGNTLKDWARCHRRSGTAPLDLVLNRRGYDDGSLDITLGNLLQDRAARDTIRRIHLKAESSGFLNSLLSRLTTNSEELQSISVESFILQAKNLFIPVDISNFFTYRRFPKLQRIELFNCSISSWDLILSQTPVLTTLDLDFNYVEPIPTISQLFSMLSYPTLRKVSLSRWGNPGSGDRNPSPRVSLCHLKELKLAGDPQNVFGLLHRLDPPTHVDNLEIVLDCEVGDISHIGPYLRDYLQHRGKSQNGLGLFLSFEDCIGRIHIGDVGGIDFSAPSPGRMDTFVVIILDFLPVHPKEIFTNLIAHIPREEIVYFRAYGEPVAMENISARFPNLGGLHLERTPLPAAFPSQTLVGVGRSSLPSGMSCWTG